MEQQPSKQMNVDKRQLFLFALACVGLGIAISAIGRFAAAIPLAVILALAATLVLPALINFISAQFGMSVLSPVAPGERLSEEDDFSKFATEFHSGPQSVLAAAPEQKPAAPAAPGRVSLNDFYAWAPDHVRVLQKLVEKSRHPETNVTDRHEMLLQAGFQVNILKQRASIPELQPAWQLASALEGLLKQLTDRAHNINHSTLRTIAGALELLSDLCKPGVRADLGSSPAIKTLIVDDDQVCRLTLSASVKKTFEQPDLAEDGPSALSQTRKQHYDLIILDVMMPGLDGFELCGKIRETPANSSTPVLFVTAMTEFDSRTKSLSMGGNDLMGKPFITFEVAVKALTLVLRSRLPASHVAQTVRDPATVTAAPSAVRWPELPPANPNEMFAPSKAPANQIESADQLESAPSVSLPPAPLADTSAPGKVEFAPGFVTYMEEFFRDLKQQLTAMDGLEDSPVLRESLVRIHLRLQTLSRRLNIPELRPAFEMCCALEGLAKKLRGEPKKVSSSVVATVGSALDLLKELLAPGVKPDLTDNPPIRMLVVDDEPLSRRALVGALQRSFARPESAEEAAGALTMASKKEFDLVFLDVFMPEMDGFTACFRLHETALNRSTPVVFITSHSDEEFRRKATQCGGKDFIVKPFDLIEIHIKALTHALRGRLEKSKTFAPATASA
jgi:CheY-like chemotaxis protein